MVPASVAVLLQGVRNQVLWRGDLESRDFGRHRLQFEKLEKYSTALLSEIRAVPSYRWIVDNQISGEICANATILCSV